VLLFNYSKFKVFLFTITESSVCCFRLEELSKPIIRETMDSVQFNPDAFDVSKAAMKAKASTRIEELAQPVQR